MAMPKTLVDLDAHYGKASNACGDIDNLVTTLTSLYDESAKWRSKYVQMKRQHFSKFLEFTHGAQLQRCFREWKDYVAEEKASREHECLLVEEEKLHREWDTKMQNQDLDHQRETQTLSMSQKKAFAELDQQMHQRAARLEQLRGERDKYLSRADKYTRTVRSVSSQLSTLEKLNMMKGPGQSKEPQTGFDVLVQGLHSLLSDSDVQYVPRAVPAESMASMVPPSRAARTPKEDCD